MNLDPDKLVVLFVIALLVLGPKRLPEVARTAGRWMAEIRKYTSSIQGELHGALGEPLKQTSALRDEFRSAMAEPRAALEVGAHEMRTSAAEVRARLEAEMAATGGDAVPAATGDSVALSPGGTPAQAVPDDPGFN